MFQSYTFRIVVFSLFAMGLAKYADSQNFGSGFQSLPNLPIFGDFTQTVFQEIPPIIMIGTKKLGKFCSGAVIDNNYILTAAHCVHDEKDFMLKDEITVYNMYGKNTGVKGRVAVFRLDLDVAMILGDFHKFVKLRADFNHTITDLIRKKPGVTMLQKMLGQTVEDGPEFVACGFPGTQAVLTCTEIEDLSGVQFSYVADGMLIKGMSGGPVLFKDADGQPTIVAVNTAVTSIPGHNVLVSPIVGMLGFFNIEPNVDR